MSTDSGLAPPTDEEVDEVLVSLFGDMSRTMADGARVRHVIRHIRKQLKELKKYREQDKERMDALFPKGPKWVQDAPDHWSATLSEELGLSCWESLGNWHWEVWNVKLDPDAEIASGKADGFEDAKAEAEAKARELAAL